MKPATFSATYADWRLIKTRRCVQIVLEVPLEAANEAYEALGGMPNAATERWVAVARLDMNAVQQGASKSQSALPEATPRQQTGAAPKYNLAQRAALLCKDHNFRTFITENTNYEPDEPTVAQLVRNYCDVDSRSEIIVGTPAGNSFEMLLNKYAGWKVGLE